MGILYLDLGKWGPALGALMKANSMAAPGDLGDLEALVTAIQNEGVPAEDPFTGDEREKMRLMLGFED
ncbi:MAG: hypothetical protein ACTSU5_21990 [Promethearchaeota archaeon]